MMRQGPGLWAAQAGGAGAVVGSLRRPASDRHCPPRCPRHRRPRPRRRRLGKRRY